MGIRFPDIVTETNQNIFYSIKDLRDAGYLGGRRPIVIMPEGSKTNGLGILNLEKEIVKLITKAAGPDENLRVHSIRFDHQYKYFSPYNSYDENGWKLFFGNLKQFTSKYKVQYFFDINGTLVDCQNDQDKHDFVQKSIMIRQKEQQMKNSSWREHKEFLKFWNEIEGGKHYEKSK